MKGEKIQKTMTINEEKPTMKVEIWSDVMCPFCYIGKRKFETALQNFPQKEEIKVTWKSFQLQPYLITDPTKNTLQHLSETKGWSMAQTRQVTARVINMAKGVGLNYDFDKAVVANSFDAHRLMQFAKTKGKGNDIEEALFKAYFVDGKNTADHKTLTDLGVSIGLNEEEVKGVLASDKFANEVKRDIYESQQVGVTGVPFFVMNDKYAISGAQEPDSFLQVLNRSYKEWKAENP